MPDLAALREPTFTVGESQAEDRAMRGGERLASRSPISTKSNVFFHAERAGCRPLTSRLAVLRLRSRGLAPISRSIHTVGAGPSPIEAPLSQEELTPHYHQQHHYHMHSQRESDS